jgi:hypothetical protein
MDVVELTNSESVSIILLTHAAWVKGPGSVSFLCQGW